MEHTGKRTNANIALEKRLNEIRRLEGVNKDLLEALKKIDESCGPLQDGEEWGDVISDIRLAARAAIGDAK